MKTRAGRGHPGLSISIRLAGVRRTTLASGPGVALLLRVVDVLRRGVGIGRELVVHRMIGLVRCHLGAALVDGVAAVELSRAVLPVLDGLIHLVRAARGR